MIQDIDKTLENLLYDRGNMSRRDVDIAFDQPTGEWAARLNRPTLNCWCFDIRENLTLRNSGMRVEQNGNRAQKSFPARRIDVTYLISSWAREVEDEHNLLWRALSTLKRIPFWKPEDCVESLRYQSRNMPTLVADMTEAPFNIVDLWGVMDNNMKLGFIFRLTVELETDILDEPPLVLKATLTVGQSEHPEDFEIQVPDTVITIPKKKSEGANQGGDES
jgi:hypothetical protein